MWYVFIRKLDTIFIHQIQTDKKLKSVGLLLAGGKNIEQAVSGGEKTVAEVDLSSPKTATLIHFWWYSQWL